MAASSMASVGWISSKRPKCVTRWQATCASSPSLRCGDEVVLKYLRRQHRLLAGVQIHQQVER